MERKSLIQSLDRALAILEAVRDSSAPMRASDIAESLGLNVATAHNIIRSLYGHGYLAQDDSSRYLLGPSCFKLCRKVSDSFEGLRRAAANPVRELAEKTGDTAFFGCERSGSLYCVAISLGGGQLVVSNVQDWLDLLHCTAAGKVVIAEKGIEWFAGLCKRQTPRRLSSRTITSVEEMAKEIKRIQAQGYSLSVGECSEEISALGIPVCGKNGEFIGALAQSFPTAYLDSGRILPKERAALLEKFAERIRHALQA